MPAQRITYELIYEPAHYNANAACTIPAAWVAYITVDSIPQPKWPCGTTRAEARAAIYREYPNVTEHHPF